MRKVTRLRQLLFGESTSYVLRVLVVVKLKQFLLMRVIKQLQVLITGRYQLMLYNKN